MDVYTELYDFVVGMSEGQNHLFLENAEPVTWKEVFPYALCKVFRIPKAYTKPTIVTFAYFSVQESIETNVFE